MFLFRPHRGLLSEAMKHVAELNDKQALINKLKDDYKQFIDPDSINDKTLVIDSYGFDSRIDWDTHIVTVIGFGVVGFINKKV